METTEKKLSPNDVIIQMLRGSNGGRPDMVYKAAESYMNSLPQSSKFYYPIRNLLREKPLTMMALNDMPTNLKNLLIVADVKDESVFLGDDVKELIQGLRLEWSNIDAYRYHNLTVRNKILLYGETGNGKTTIAKHIANLARLPFIEVKSDIVIDSHLGSTSKNIFTILNSIKQPCVLFWDEVDSIGKRRGGSSDNSGQHENDRMTNSILTNLDKVWDETIFIAATNRMDILDSAFLRRFDVKHEIKAPTPEEKERFTIQQFEYYKIPATLLPGDYSRFKNYAEIKQHILSVARKYVIDEILSKEGSDAN